MAARRTSRGIAWTAGMLAPVAILMAWPATAVNASAPSGCRYDGQVIVPVCPNINCPPGRVPAWLGDCADPSYALIPVMPARGAAPTPA